MDNSSFNYASTNSTIEQEPADRTFPLQAAGPIGMGTVQLTQGGTIYYGECRDAGTCVVEPWVFPESKSELMCAQVLLSGSIMLQKASGELLQQNADTALLFHIGEQGARMQPSDGQVIRYVGVALSLDCDVLQMATVSTLIQSLCRQKRETPIMAIDLQAQTRKWAAELYRQVANTGPAAELQREGLARCYLSSLLHDYTLVQPSSEETGNTLTAGEIRCSEQICAYIDANLDRALSIPALEDRFGLSRYRLNDLFRLLHGQTISDYVRQQRLNRARQLIEREGVPVKVAAFSTGYRHVSNFSRAYREYFGCTPGHSSQSQMTERQGLLRR